MITIYLEEVRRKNLGWVQDPPIYLGSLESNAVEINQIINLVEKWVEEIKAEG